MQGVGLEALAGARPLTGLMVVLFLRDWRSVVVVVPQHPAGAAGQRLRPVADGAHDQPHDAGRAGAGRVGILVDEATVEVENIHTQFEHTPLHRPAPSGAATPRRLCPPCWRCCASSPLFIPLVLHAGGGPGAVRTDGAGRRLRHGDEAISCRARLVPVLSTWLLRHYHTDANAKPGRFSVARLRDGYARLLQSGLARPLAGTGGLRGGCRGAGLVVGRRPRGPRYAKSSPTVDSGQFLLRLRAPDGTPLEETEALAKDVLNAIADKCRSRERGETVSLVGTASYNYPINSIYLWTAGPQEAVMRIGLKRGKRRPRGRGEGTACAGNSRVAPERTPHT